MLGTPESFKESVKKAHHDVSGENNPAFGKRRITNGIREKRIPMDEPIPEGWVEGGKLKSKSKIRSKPVELLSIKYGYALVFSSCQEAGEVIKGSPKKLMDVARGGTQSHKGWKVRYI